MRNQLTECVHIAVVLSEIFADRLYCNRKQVCQQWRFNEYYRGWHTSFQVLYMKACMNSTPLENLYEFREEEYWQRALECHLSYLMLPNLLNLHPCRIPICGSQIRGPTDCHDSLWLAMSKLGGNFPAQGVSCSSRSLTSFYHTYNLTRALSVP